MQNIDLKKLNSLSYIMECLCKDFKTFANDTVKEKLDGLYGHLEYINYEFDNETFKSLYDVFTECKNAIYDMKKTLIGDNNVDYLYNVVDFIDEEYMKLM